jgi:3-phenylpropionate/trans-cinnamate dioxygenase ferredoxin component
VSVGGRQDAGQGVAQGVRERVGATSAFAEESLTALTVAGQEIVLVRHRGRFYAVPDMCTHARFPLHDGSLDEGRIVCCHHGARFDLETGRPTLPAVKPLARYPVDVDGDDVYVTLP